jgi:hypothetical protein
VDGVAQETVLEVEVVVFVDFVVREGVTVEVPGLMVDLELELENEGIREDDEESSFELDWEDKVLCEEDEGPSELLGVVKDELWNAVELDVVEDELFLLLLLEKDLVMTELVEVVDAEVCDIEELCEIEDDTDKLLFDEDVD